MKKNFQESSAYTHCSNNVHLLVHFKCPEDSPVYVLFEEQGVEDVGVGIMIAYGFRLPEC